MPTLGGAKNTTATFPSTTTPTPTPTPPTKLNVKDSGTIHFNSMELSLIIYQLFNYLLIIILLIIN